MLREKQISAFATWDLVADQFKADPRCTALPQKEKLAAFDQYVFLPSVSLLPVFLAIVCTVCLLLIFRSCCFFCLCICLSLPFGLPACLPIYLCFLHNKLHPCLFVSHSLILPSLLSSAPLLSRSNQQIPTSTRRDREARAAGKNPKSQRRVQQAAARERQINQIHIH